MEIWMDELARNNTKTEPSNQSQDFDTLKVWLFDINTLISIPFGPALTILNKHQ